MGMILIYGLILLLGLSILGVGLFVYSRKNKSKIGLVVSLLILSVVIVCLFINTIDEFTFSKKDVVKDLTHLAIELKDDFEITDNKVTGFPERHQKTQIRVSQRDKEAFIQAIVSSDNFRSLVDEEGMMQVYTNDYPELGKIGVVYNLRYPDLYARKAYLTLENFPTRLEVFIPDSSNLVTYQRLED